MFCAIMFSLSHFKGVICNLSICITWHYTRNLCFWSSYFWVLRMITSHFCHIQFFFPQLVAVSVLFVMILCRLMWSKQNHVITTESSDPNKIMWSQHVIQFKSDHFFLTWDIWFNIIEISFGWIYLVVVEKHKFCSFPLPNIYICGIINEQMHSCPSIVIQMNHLLDNIP